MDGLENQLIAKYALTKYALLYAVRRVLEADGFGQQLLGSPEKFIRGKAEREPLMRVIDEVLDGLVIDLNVEASELGDDFDYRGKMRDRTYVTELTGKLVGSYQKDIKRKKAKPMEQSWAEATKV